MMMVKLMVPLRLNASVGYTSAKPFDAMQGRSRDHKKHHLITSSPNECRIGIGLFLDTNGG